MWVTAMLGGAGVPPGVMLFFQPKGRKVVAEFDGKLFKTGDELEALRPLNDLRAPNAATSECVRLERSKLSAQ